MILAILWIIASIPLGLLTGAFFKAAEEQRNDRAERASFHGAFNSQGRGQDNV